MLRLLIPDNRAYVTPTLENRVWVFETRCGVATGPGSLHSTLFVRVGFCLVGGEQTLPARGWGSMAGLGLALGVRALALGLG